MSNSIGIKVQNSNHKQFEFQIYSKIYIKKVLDKALLFFYCKRHNEGGNL